MASGTALGGDNANAPLCTAVQPEAIVEQRVGQARRQVKWVDLLGGLLTLCVGLLAYMLAVAVLDHWVVRGGLGTLGRLGLFAVLVGTGGYYCWRRVWPALRYPINPIYAAQTIERSRPTIKNTLINFLLLRRRPEEVSPVVFQALQQRAAADVAQVPIESVVDWPRVFRLGYLLAAALAAFCLYLIISPKSPLVSAARVLLPWADIDAPTRVTITEVEPGDAVRFHGEFLAVSVVVRGNREDEPVLLVFSTADGQVIDQTIPMKRTGQGDSYTATLPPGSLGLQQNYWYRITAGDCTTKDYHVVVHIPPAIVVEAIDYHYPPYTKLADRTVYRQGDIRAIEGTEVAVHAAANQEILRAEIDLGCDGRHNLPMQVKGAQASGRFTLRMSKDDPLRPEFEAYQVRFTDRNRNANRWPSRHAIEVVPDLSPEVELLEPTQPEIVVPLDGSVVIKAAARDPDFGLRRVAVRAMRGEAELPLAPLLDKSAPQPAHQGDFQGQLAFEPQKLNLKPGDRVAYWAQAEDNKEVGGRPAPNVSTTERRWIIIAPTQADQQAEPKPGQQQQPPQSPRQDGQRGQPGDNASHNDNQQMEHQPQQPGDAEKQPNATQNQEPSGGQKTQPSQPGQSQEERRPDQPQEQSPQGDGQQQPSGQPGGADRPSANKPSARREPIDSQANPGDAIEEINRHREEELARQDNQGGAGKQGSSAKQDNQATQGADQPGTKPDERQLAQNSDQSPPDKRLQQQPGAEKQPGQQKQPTAENQPGEHKQPSGEQQPGGQMQPAAERRPDQQPGQEQSTQPQKQPGTPSQEKLGPQKPDQQPFGEQPREGQPGERPSGQQQPGQDPTQCQGDGQSSKTAGEKQAGQQPAGGNTGKEPPSGEQGKQPSGQKPGQKPGRPEQQPGTAPQTADKPQSEQAAEKPGQAPSRPEAGEPAGTPSQKPSVGQPGQKQPVGPQEHQPAEPGKQPEQKPARPQSGGKPTTEQEKPAGQAEPGTQQGSPEAQADNRQRERQPAGGPPGKPEPKEKPQSPSVSGRQSDGRQESDSEGDRSGGRSQGGGERSDSPGLGTSGSSTDAQSGGEKSKQAGKGETGTRAGEEVETDKTTGKQAVRREGQSSDSEKGKPEPSDRPGGKQTSRDTPGGQQRSGDGPQTGEPKGQSDSPGRSGQGTPVTGGKAGDSDVVAPPPAESEPGGDDPNLEYARKQTILALEHLKDQLAKEKPDLLDRLGWTPEEARKFIERWEQLYRRAGDASRGPEAKAAKRQLDDALRSLGLRPRGTELRGGQTPRKTSPKIDPGRATPPAEWAELVREYSRGVAEGER